ncbi:ATP-binding cassette domain-containing protein [Microtetraspora malaysiensis]|uniref:ATP-binding cassette domain-containing protein n=1 Tax=Microtetraspora malaysiensis TaxID=161358 RepID=UPI00082C7A98|nr:ATP-binding cassette domain-containing protein [Microtetraspora malaysiensis]
MTIEIRGLTKVFQGRVRALAEVTLSVPSGVFGLFGATGAGKSTLLRILAGLVRPTSGKVELDGRELVGPVGRDVGLQMVGYVPQAPGRYPDLTVPEYLNYVGLSRGLDDRTLRRRRIAEVVELVGLAEAAHRNMAEFGGELLRRVSVAAALITDPRLLVIDELPGRLTPDERASLWELAAALGEERMVMVSSRTMDDGLLRVCGGMAVLAGGRVTYSAEGDRLP